MVKRDLQNLQTGFQNAVTHSHQLNLFFGRHFLSVSNMLTQIHKLFHMYVNACKHSSHTHTLTHSFSLSPSPTHTNVHTHSKTQTHNNTHAHSNSVSLKLTHTHTHLASTHAKNKWKHAWKLVFSYFFAPFFDSILK